MSKQPEYSNAFIRKCELLFQDIRENKPLKTCIEKLRDAQQQQQPPEPSSEDSTSRFEPLWFIYYMYFAIHNPKLEEYINMKHSSTNSNEEIDILKNMIRRRANTSTLVFQLYMYANIQKGAVTYIYPSSASSSSSSNPPVSILKSLASSHLKTAAAVIHKLQTDKRISIETIYAVYIANLGIPSSPSSKLSNIKYTRKDIIFLALVCYMKIDEIDINTKGIFIAATKEEIAATETATKEEIAATETATTPHTTTPHTTTPHTTTATTPHPNYDQKYKYLLT